MEANENRETTETDAGGEQSGTSADTQAFVETMGAAFEDVFEFGPTVETSSRSIDDDVAAARRTAIGDQEQAAVVSATVSESNKEETTTPQTVVSERSVDEVLDTLEEQSDPPWSSR
jgi:hypothetical protein